MRQLITIVSILCFAVLTGGCLEESEDDFIEEDDLPLGDLTVEDSKDDGLWGYALQCKTIPDYPSLSQPRIVISLNGLTLHLVDEQAGYDKVFPIGVGTINQNASESTYSESLSYYPLLRTGRQDFTMNPSRSNPCKIWWTDRETGRRLPVFAGMPFMSWYGSYGIHGPIDNYRARNGGNLRRGYVSHGCIRMESADVLEVYSRTMHLSSVPVHVQREPERGADGRRFDVDDVWLGAECEFDQECNYDGGICLQNPYSGRGFCSQECTRYCPDRDGQPVSFCVPDPNDAQRGVCVLKESGLNEGCRPLDHMVPTAVSRFNQSWVRTTACMPGSPGWIGDRCLGDYDCTLGTSCARLAHGDWGFCSESCTRYCPDQPGYPWTFCVHEPAFGGSVCMRQCTPDSFASECPAGFECLERPRAQYSSPIRNVCLPSDLAE